MSELFAQTAKEMEGLAVRHPSILCAYSGGKDSLATLDLCCRFFRHVEAYYLHLVPGLRYTADRLAVARERWPGVNIHEAPGQQFFAALENGWYCDPRPELRGFKCPNLNGYAELLMRKLGIPIAANGARMHDFRNRRQQIKCQKDRAIIYPIREWSKAHVLKYLMMQGIPVPRDDGRASGDIDLSSVRSLLAVADRCPEDWRTLKRFFPQLEAVRARRDYYGVA